MITGFVLGFVSALVLLALIRRANELAPSEDKSGDFATIRLEGVGYAGWIVKTVVNGVQTTRIYESMTSAQVLTRETTLVKEQTKCENVKISIKVKY